MSQITDPDAYCIYCQKQYASVPNLYRHIIRRHYGSWAYWSVVPDEVRDRYQSLSTRKPTA